jgi:cytochrome c oxidase subunit 3
VILIDPFALPLLNTVILLTSSVTVTWAHATLVNGRHFETAIALFLTTLCGCIFLLGQIYEYNSSFFAMSTSVYGSLFYLLTGFHGFHVLCGTLFLFSTLILLLQRAFSTTRHLVFECAA